MMRRWASVVGLLVLGCKGGAGSGNEAPRAETVTHGITPSETPPRSLAALPDGRSALGPFAVRVPEAWKPLPSRSSMRAAQFELPAAAGKAEVIVYYFGAAGAGSVQDNVDRWLSQFQQPDGRSSREVASVEDVRFAGQQASLISVSGRHVAAAMPGGEPIDKPDQALVAAIVNSPEGPYYFRLIGDRAAVAAETPSFRQMLDSLEVR